MNCLQAKPIIRHLRRRASVRPLIDRVRQLRLFLARSRRRLLRQRMSGYGMLRTSAPRRAAWRATLLTLIDPGASIGL